MEPSDRIGQKPQVAMWPPKTTHNAVFVLFPSIRMVRYCTIYRNPPKKGIYGSPPPPTVCIILQWGRQRKNQSMLYELLLSTV
ncbi:hypothetical protein QTP88_002466 [Uroleucon formosanum]